MIIRKQNIRQLSFFMTIIMIILMLCPTFVLLFYQNNENINSLSFDLLESPLNSLLPGENQFYFIALLESNILSGTLIRSLSKSVQGWQKLIYTIYSIRVPLICISLTTCGFLYLTGKTNKHISIIALSIGGHEPPII